jgi:acyl dehydratase
MLDNRHIGLELPPFDVEIERGALLGFARALGETNPIYTDDAAARAAGHRSILAMPTFPVVPGTREELTWGMVKTLGVDPAKILHGSQRYVWHAPICAGDRLRGVKRVVNLYQKKALGFIDTVIEYRDLQGQLICEDFCTFVVRP